jgi:hypothetical protein
MTPPFPPHDTMPGTQLLFTAMNFVILLAVVVLLMRYSWKNRDWIPAWLLVGGCLGTLLEPVVDVVNLIWYPPKGNWTVLQMGGIHTPLLCIPGYIWLYGGLGALFYVFLRSGASRADVWKAFVGLMIFLALVEFVGSGTGVYYYYGAQPLRIFRYCAYWGFINASVPIIIGVAIYLLRPHVPGWRGVFVIPLVPFAIGASFFGGGFPVHLALNNAPLPWIVTQLAGIATALLCTGAVWIATRAVPVKRTAIGAADAGAVRAASTGASA